MNDLTLIEKIQREQSETAADLEIFLETGKRIAAHDIKAIQKKQLEINDLIHQIAQEQTEVQK